jgi:hypothetical protein
MISSKPRRPKTFAPMTLVSTIARALNTES